jgi:hypothetical protein
MSCFPCCMLQCCMLHLMYVACCMLHVVCVACCMLHVVFFLHIACCLLHIVLCMLHAVICTLSVLHILPVACCMLQVTLRATCLFACFLFCVHGASCVVGTSMPLLAFRLLAEFTLNDCMVERLVLCVACCRNIPSVAAGTLPSHGIHCAT